MLLCQLKLIILAALVADQVVSGFYLPGLAPKTYCKKSVETKTCPSQVDIFVNRLDSIESVLPFEYDHFDFCKADVDERSPSENLGQLMFGERIRPSPYKLDFLNPVKCVKVCTKEYKIGESKDIKKLRLLKKAMNLNYQQHWIVDNLPITWCYITDTNREFCSRGFPIGCFVNKFGVKKDACSLFKNFNRPSSYYVFNHLDIQITYRSGKNEEWGASFMEEGGRIISAKVNVRSISADSKDCQSQEPLRLSGNPKEAKEYTIPYTYSVSYKQRHDIKWASRWDYILDSMPQAKIQWFSIANSLIIVLFLSGMVATILLRTIHKDLIKYNSSLNSGGEDVGEEEFGWKLVHGDVFRTPNYPLFLSVFVGTGVQIVAMTFITLFLACLGFLSPASRGALMTSAVVVYVLLGTPGGYYSARLYKMFGGENWAMNVMANAFLCPGIVFIIFFILNTVLWINDSSAAMPFLTLLSLLALWFLVSTPLVFIGSYLGFKKQTIENPVRTNQIPRQIPTQYYYTQRTTGVIMGGVLPFGCIFIQLFFILNSIWSHQFYYMFGFMTVVYLILIITCTETTILLCYFHLCTEDYRWWWRSFLTSGFSSVYFFIYSIHYYATKLDIQGSASMFLYFGYTLIMTFLFFLFAGKLIENGTNFYHY